MGYDLYFVNHTKRQIVGSKKLHGGFEAGQQLLAYLSMCNGCEIEIMGEDRDFIEKNVFVIGKSTEYKVIDLYEFRITGPHCSQSDQEGVNEAELTRLFDLVHEEDE